MQRVYGGVVRPVRARFVTSQNKIIARKYKTGAKRFNRDRLFGLGDRVVAARTRHVHVIIIITITISRLSKSVLREPRVVITRRAHGASV